MLPKHKRIPREDFGPLLASRIFVHSPHFTLRVAPGRGLAAVSVSKKVSKKAVERNRVRRRVYSVLKDLLPSRGLYLFVAKSGAVSAKGEALQHEIRNLLKEADKRYNS